MRGMRKMRSIKKHVSHKPQISSLTYDSSESKHTHIKEL